MNRDTYPASSIMLALLCVNLRATSYLPTCSVSVSCCDLGYIDVGLVTWIVLYLGFRPWKDRFVTHFFCFFTVCLALTSGRVLGHF